MYRVIVGYTFIPAIYLSTSSGDSYKLAKIGSAGRECCRGRSRANNVTGYRKIFHILQPAQSTECIDCNFDRLTQTNRPTDLQAKYMNGPATNKRSPKPPISCTARASNR